MKIQNNEKACSIHFKSILELLEYKYEGYSDFQFYNYLNGTSRKKIEWLGMENSCNKDVINHALLGHNKMYKELLCRAKWFSNQTREEYEQLIVKRKRKRIKGSEGDEFDVHEANLGNLDRCWTKRKHIETSKKTNLITILIDIGGNISESVDDSLWRSAVAVKLCDQLITAGKSVRIICGSASGGLYSGDRRIHTTTITIKEYNEPLSMDRLSAMTHLGFHRTFNFAARCCFNKRGLSDSMGFSSGWLKENSPVTMADEIKLGHTKYIYIARANSRIEGIASLEHAYQQMKEFATEA